MTAEDYSKGALAIYTQYLGRRIMPDGFFRLEGNEYVFEFKTLDDVDPDAMAKAVKSAEAYYSKLLSLDEPNQYLGRRNQMQDHIHDTRGIDYSCWKCSDPRRVEIENAAKTSVRTESANEATQEG